MTTFKRPCWDEKDNAITLESNQLAYKILMQAGEHFNKIHWADAEAPDGFSIDSKLNELSTKCKNLESFSFEKCNVEPWILAFGSQMKVVNFPSWTTRDTLMFSVSHCTNICEVSLTLSCSSWIDGPNLWENIGNTLENLKLTLYGEGEYEADGELLKIQEYCRRLKSIGIIIVDASSTGLAPCLASYGGQLQYANVHTMKYEELQQVVEKCVNARFEIQIEGDRFVDSLCLVGHQLEKLFFHRLLYQNAESVDHTRVWDLCPNVQIISAPDPMKLCGVEAIFNSPKPFLRDVCLNFLVQSTDITKVMRAFASGGVTSLESVSFRLRLPPPNTFNKLVQMNESLREVRIEFEETEDVDNADIVRRGIEISNCFLISTDITFLEIIEYG